MRTTLLVVICFCSFQSFAQSYLDFYFKSKEIEGAIVLYNENKDEWIFSNETDALSNSPIAGHFQLWMALVGLKHQIFDVSENKFMPWDGVQRYYFEQRKPEWNQNTNLVQAIRFQTDWYFEQLKERLPLEEYRHFVKTNPLFTEVNNNVWEKFWNYGALTNPKTMILFIKDLYYGELDFNSYHQKFVFNQMLIDQKLALRTVTTSFEGKKIDWTLGVYFTKEKPIYFSLRTQRSLDFPENEDYEKQRNLLISEIFDVLNLKNPS